MPKNEEKKIGKQEKQSRSDHNADREKLPQNVVKIGEQVLQDKNIYIHQAVYKEIHRFTKDKLTVESGGMLMGYTLQTNEKTNIIITGFIEGKYSEGTPTTLKFTHETWDYVHGEADKKFPDDKIIGWIHTHPNFGIFLSNYDKFIHQNFFNEENQIAYVVDPIQNIEGFFFWINGQIEKCPGYYIYDAIGAEIDTPEESLGNPNNSMVTPSTLNSFKLFYILVCAISVVGIIGFVVLSVRISNMQESIHEMNEQLMTQNQSIENRVLAADQKITNVDSNIKKHTIIFLSANGTILSKTDYSTGDMIVPPTENPPKSPDEKYCYIFDGWDGYVGYAIGNAIYKPVYKLSLREYTITFEDEDGKIISKNTYHYGDKVLAPNYPTDDSTGDGTGFKWDKEIEIVTADTTYKLIKNKDAGEVDSKNENDSNSDDNSRQDSSSTLESSQNE